MLRLSGPWFEGKERINYIYKHYNVVMFGYHHVPVNSLQTLLDHDILYTLYIGGPSLLIFYLGCEHIYVYKLACNCLFLYCYCLFLVLGLYQPHKMRFLSSLPNILAKQTKYQAVLSARRPATWSNKIGLSDKNLFPVRHFQCSLWDLD